MTLCPDLAKYPPSLWRGPGRAGLPWNPWSVVTHWMPVARSIQRGDAIKHVSEKHACTAGEVEEILQLRGALFAAQQFARVQGAAWRRFAGRRYPFAGFEPKEQHAELSRQWDEQLRALRIARNLSRRLVRRAESAWRLYRIGFWLARKQSPLEPRHGRETAARGETLWREAWGERAALVRHVAEEP